MKAENDKGDTWVIETTNGKTLVNGKEVNVDKLEINPGMSHWLVNNRSYTVELIEKKENKNYIIRVNNSIVNIRLKDKMDVLLHELGMDAQVSDKVNDLKAPMPGLVVDIKVVEGQEVKKGDTIIVLEAMKMENALKAVANATVKKINAVKGTAVEKNQVLVHFS